MTVTGMQSDQRGVSLTEAIIALGLLLVALYCTYSVLGTALNCHRSSSLYLQALYACSGTLSRLDATPLTRVPPEVLDLSAVDRFPHTWKLANRNLVPDSLCLQFEDGAAFQGQYRLDTGTGRLTVNGTRSRGRLLVGYAYELGPEQLWTDLAVSLPAARVRVEGGTTDVPRLGAGAQSPARDPVLLPTGRPIKSVRVTLFWEDRGTERSLHLSRLKVR